MENTRIDLKQLIFLIKENKGLKANLILDEGCVFQTADPNPLIKVINYLINYLEQYTSQPLEISLDLFPGNCALTFLAYTRQSVFPSLSANLSEALSDYRATVEFSVQQGKYAQIKILFEK